MFCRHHTCSWSGLAVYDPNTKILETQQVEERSHGQKKDPASRRGRRPRALARSFKVTESLHYSGETQPATVCSFIEKHFAQGPLHESCGVTCKPRKSTKQAQKFHFFCYTHWDRATKKKCTWCGAGKLLPAEGGESGHVLELRIMPRMNVHSGEL